MLALSRIINISIVAKITILYAKTEGITWLKIHMLQRKKRKVKTNYRISKADQKVHRLLDIKAKETF